MFLKVLLVIAIYIATYTVLCAENHGYSTIPGNNSHYVEGFSKYIWMHDGNGVPCLIDLTAKDPTMNLNTDYGAQNQYWLYTRSNPTNPKMITLGSNDSIKLSNYDSKKLLTVLVHGYLNDRDSEVNKLITKQLLKAFDANVIVVDWSSLAHSIFYHTACFGVPSVGRHLGNFLNWLISYDGGNWDNVHLVGFSLGAHVVGNAGRFCNSRPKRITGLDPAGPLWYFSPYTLKATDGRYVEAIHTDGGILGILSPIGMANFYPNGGMGFQPGCAIFSPCSHSRSYELFAASILHDDFLGKKCLSIIEDRMHLCDGPTLKMGNNVIGKQGHGIYLLSTTGTWPYYK